MILFPPIFTTIFSVLSLTKFLYPSTVEKLFNDIKRLFSMVLTYPKTKSFFMIFIPWLLNPKIEDKNNKNIIRYFFIFEDFIYEIIIK